MRKKPLISMLLSLLYLCLAGWCIKAVYDINLQFTQIMKDPEPPWEITAPILPFLLLFLYCLILISMYVFKKKGKEKISFWLYPLEFSESDEREREISAEACRKAFITTWATAPLAALLMSFYPFIQLSYLPIILILLIPATQVVTYFIHIRKI